ncbi:MAG: PRC-barrel domain-containing protein [Vicinamibacterales bacterium]
MLNDAQLSDTSQLSYLESSKVSSPAGALSELDVLSAEGQRLGRIEGVVIDAGARRVLYLSVRSSGWFGRGRYLVHADQLGQVDEEHKALRLCVNLRDEAVQGLNAAALRRFSDEDVLAAMFPTRAA